MATKKPRQSQDPAMGAFAAAEAQKAAQAAHETEHQTFTQRYGFGGAGSTPTPQRTIPSANQVAALKGHPEYEMWNDYRKEKD